LSKAHKLLQKAQQLKQNKIILAAAFGVPCASKKLKQVAGDRSEPSE